MVSTRICHHGIESMEAGAEICRGDSLRVSTCNDTPCPRDYTFDIPFSE